MLLVLEHSPSSPLGTLGPVLNEFAQRLRIVQLHAGGALPADLDDIDGIIALGGPQSANDAGPTVDRELALLREAHEREMPVLGICLGAQLLARALGGEVARMAAPEIGFGEVRLTPIGREDPLFAGIAWTSPQFHWHGEEVTRLPVGARPLASSAACKVQAFGVGLRTYGLQYHPEVDAAILQRMVRDGAHELSTNRIEPNAILVDAQTHLADVERLARRLFESWALLVAPVDRRYGGVARDPVH